MTEAQTAVRMAAAHKAVAEGMPAEDMHLAAAFLPGRKDERRSSLRRCTNGR